jgi:hypothetical protein
MPQRNYQRTVPELRKLASMFWPSELSEEAAKLSVIPLLLKTQDEFIAILSVPVPDLRNLFQIVNASSFSGNLFLKHLVILADFGGEQLQRINSSFEMLFPSGKMEYLWNGQYLRQFLIWLNSANCPTICCENFTVRILHIVALLSKIALIRLFFDFGEGIEW